MIARGRIVKQADADGVPAATVERDYVLAHVLAGIAAQPDADQMVFKGGTALRMCHFEDYRYSADLDFSLVDGMTLDDARTLVRNALDSTSEQISFPHLTMTEHDPPRIAYRGPLGRERLLKLDLADDELVDAPATRPILQRYPDQQETTITVYTLQEVTAEKLRCIIQRVQCRDLFDLHELLVDNAISADETWDLFERKARHRGIDPTTFAARFEDRLERYRRLWNSELDEHVPDEPPPFNATERAVRRALRGHL